MRKSPWLLFVVLVLSACGSNRLARIPDDSTDHALRTIAAASGVHAAKTAAWQNAANPRDVDRDGDVDEDDLELVTDVVRAHGVGNILPNESFTNAPDVNGDNVLSAMDLLVIVNHLRNPSTEPYYISLDVRFMDNSIDEVGFRILVSDGSGSPQVFEQPAFPGTGEHTIRLTNVRPRKPIHVQVAVRGADPFWSLSDPFTMAP